MASPPQPIYSDRYEPIRLIARGGMAEVWLAQDALLDRMVALKVLFPELSVDPNFVERFRREAQAAANLSHPNIVSVYDWGETGGTYFIVMEYVEGRPLSGVLREDGPLLADRAAAIGADVAAALGFAHRNGVIHRDVKPGNVLVTSDDHVKVTDFGIARASNTSDHLTQTGSVMGTATYFSPEQAQGLAVDQRSDVYSLGVVLYEMVTGTPPFVAESPIATAYKHVHQDPLPPTALKAEIPTAFEAIILQALAKDLSHRYASAEELRADLLRYKQGRSVLAEPPPLMGHAPLATPPSRPASARAVRTVPATATGAAVGAAAAAGLGAAAAAGGSGSGAAGIPAGDGRGFATSAADPRTQVVSATEVTTDPKHHSGSIWVYVVLLAILLAALGVVLFLLSRQVDLGGGGGGASTAAKKAAAAPVRIPADLLGKQYNDAVAELQRLGATSVTRKQVSDSSHAAETVTATVPAGGQQLGVGGTVELDVATGPEPVNEPDVVGATLAVATQDLQTAGLKVGPPTSQDSTSTPAGQVMAQNPPQGSQLQPGSTVTLTVSDGKGEALVPDETGKTELTAENDLQAAGLSAYVAGHDQSGSVPAGSVVRTTPVSGTALPKGSKVGLTLSSGPGKVHVPYVKGEQESAAKQAIEARQLVVAETTQVVTSPSQDGVVIDLTPGGGTLVDQGSTVNLVVGQYTSTPTTFGATTTSLPF